MPMDIRDYLPPSLKHVMAHANPAERKRRKQAARDAFGRPTPVPAQDAEPGDDDPTLEKVQEASPWSARETSRVDKGALPSALMPPTEAIERARPETAPVVKPAKPDGVRAPATVRVVPLRVVVLAALSGLAAGGIVIARAMLATTPGPAAATQIVTARAIATAAATPSMAAEPSAVLMGAAPTASGVASAAPVVAPSATATATAVPSANPREKSTPDPPDPYAEPAPTVKRPAYVEKRPEF